MGGKLVYPEAVLIYWALQDLQTRIWNYFAAIFGYVTMLAALEAQGKHLVNFRNVDMQ
jgi:hypothetical protein